jgi:hypothetical protein
MDPPETFASRAKSPRSGVAVAPSWRAAIARWFLAGLAFLR